jgi:hypothetical protein
VTSPYTCTNCTTRHQSANNNELLNRTARRALLVQDDAPDAQDS